MLGCCEGFVLGNDDGFAVGKSLVGNTDGLTVGDALGARDGCEVGCKV